MGIEGWTERERENRERRRKREIMVMYEWEGISIALPPVAYMYTYRYMDITRCYVVSCLIQTNVKFVQTQYATNNMTNQLQG